MSTILVLGGVILAAAAAAAVLRRDKKRGKASCGCDCAHCASCGACQRLNTAGGKAQVGISHGKSI
ncbi:MAG: FeoB-associated Cys-rich membrane protein [Clostridiales bacterium]|nr:FeoB-associated Cys-rich membrane protein [Clostridiales bacterium]